MEVKLEEQDRDVTNATFKTDAGKISLSVPPGGFSRELSVRISTSPAVAVLLYCSRAYFWKGQVKAAWYT